MKSIGKRRKLYQKYEENQRHLNHPGFLRHQDKTGLPGSFILFILVPYQDGITSSKTALETTQDRQTFQGLPDGVEEQFCFALVNRRRF